MGGVDPQQRPRGLDRLRLSGAVAQGRFPGQAGDGHQPLPFLREPGVEARIETFQILQEPFAQQFQQFDPGRGRVGGDQGIDRDEARIHRQMMPLGDQNPAPGGAEGFLHLMHGLAQRGAGLFLFPLAP